MFKIKKNYRFLFNIYLFSNILGFIYIWNTKTLIGDYKDISLYSKDALIYAIIIIVITLFLLQGFLFNFLEKTSINDFKVEINNYVDKKVGYILLILQLLFFMYCMYYNVGVAASENISKSTLLRKIWLLIPIDWMFLIYYSLNKKNNLYRVNLLVYIISNIARGWSGQFLFLFFFEYKKIKKNKILLLFFIIIILIIYPIITEIKFFIRSNNNFDINLNVIYDLITNIDIITYLKDYEFFFTNLIGRLSVISNVVEILHHVNYFELLYNKNKIEPFFMEGNIQYIIKKIMDIPFKNNFPKELAVYANTNIVDNQVLQENTSTALNVTLLGWLLILNEKSVYFILYLLLLIKLTFYFFNKIPFKINYDVIWLLMLILLFHGWLSAFVSFIWAIIIYLIIVKIIQFFEKFTY